MFTRNIYTAFTEPYTHFWRSGHSLKRFAIQISLHPENPGLAVPSDFLGLSYEDPVLAGGYFDVNNKVYLNLLSNLGQGILRFGGNQVEHTFWSRAPGVTFPNARAVLSPQNIDRLFAFASKTGWRVILGLNLTANNPSIAADEATYAMQAGKNSIIAFEIGNEPDLYSRNGLRPSTYAYTDFKGEFETYLKAIREAVPEAPIAGPATANTYSWFSSFLKDEASNLVLATDHYYPLNGTPTLTPTDALYPTIDKLLSQDTARQSADTTARFENSALTNHIQLRFEEINSATLGGKEGVSDVFASALWSADYMFDLAKRGVVGVNLHGGFSTQGYTPISLDPSGQYRAQPLYYGMLFFHAAARGRIIPVEVNSPINLTAYAFLDNDSTLREVIINKDPAQAANCEIQTGKSFNRVSSLRLLAFSLQSQAGVSLGGTSVNLDGTWFPKIDEQAGQAGTQYQIEVPAASAVVVTFR